MIGIAISEEAPSKNIENVVCFYTLQILPEDFDAEDVVWEGVQLWSVLDGFAAVLFDEGAAGSAHGELPIDGVQSVEEDGADETLVEIWKDDGDHSDSGKEDDC